MNGPAKYLHDLRVEELAEELRRSGHSVGQGERFDLVAAKDGRRVAYEVMLRPVDDASWRQFHEQREQAERDGLDDVRLVLVVPPRMARLEVERLEDRLLEAMQERPPAGLSEFGPEATIREVLDVSLDALVLQPDVFVAAGIGVVALEWHPGSDARTRQELLPLAFRAHLDSSLRVRRLEHLQIDWSAADRELAGHHQG